MKMAADDTRDSADHVNWYASRGAITNEGVYTAPASVGPEWVQAPSSMYPDLGDTVAIKVVDR